MILYFTGTGNCRYVADFLADLLGDEALSISELAKEKPVNLSSSKPYVIVNPVYVSAPPKFVQDFMNTAGFSGSNDCYFVMTCAGGMGARPAYAERICKKIGLNYMGTAQIIMPQNYLVFFKTKSSEEAARIVDNAAEPIRKLAEIISAGEMFPNSGMKKWEVVATDLIINMYYKYFISAKKFTVSEKCIGCGICENKCPLNNIHIKDGKPSWGSDCTHCMACISMCPKEAIEYGKASVGKPRNRCITYHNDTGKGHSC